MSYVSGEWHVRDIDTALCPFGVHQRNMMLMIDNKLL